MSGVDVLGVFDRLYALRPMIESAGDAQPNLDNARLIGSGAYRRLVAAHARIKEQTV